MLVLVHVHLKVCLWYFLIIWSLAVIVVVGYLCFQLYGYLRFLCFVEFQENEKTANRNWTSKGSEETVEKIECQGHGWTGSNSGLTEWHDGMSVISLWRNVFQPEGGLKIWLIQPPSCGGRADQCRGCLFACVNSWSPSVWRKEAQLFMWT